MSNTWEKVQMWFQAFNEIEHAICADLDSLDFPRERPWIDVLFPTHFTKLEKQQMLQMNAPNNASKESSVLRLWKNDLGKALRKTAILQLQPSYFARANEPGDFSYEITNNSEPGTLYIFNDNVVDHATSHAGAGNAAIRKYNQYARGKTRSAGISTGWSFNGFQNLQQTNPNTSSSKTAKDIIDEDFKQIVEIIVRHGYTKITYSCASPTSTTLGVGLFNVGDDVKTYIVTKLRSLEASVYYEPADLVRISYFLTEWREAARQIVPTPGTIFATFFDFDFFQSANVDHFAIPRLIQIQSDSNSDIINNFTYVQDPGGAANIGYAMSKKYPSQKIGIMVAGNSGRMAGSVGEPNGYDVREHQIHGWHTTQEEDVVSGALLATRARYMQHGEIYTLSDLFRSRFGLAQFGMHQPCSPNPATRQGCDFRKAKNAEAYQASCTVDTFMCKKVDNVYIAADLYPATLVFVAGPNAGKRGHEYGSMTMTLNEKCATDYRFFRECVKTAMCAALDAMIMKEVKIAILARISCGIYAAHHKRKINDEIQDIVKECMAEPFFSFKDGLIIFNKPRYEHFDRVILADTGSASEKKERMMVSNPDPDDEPDPDNFDERQGFHDTGEARKRARSDGGGSDSRKYQEAVVRNNEDEKINMLSFDAASRLYAPSISNETHVYVTERMICREGDMYDVYDFQTREYKGRTYAKNIHIVDPEGGGTFVLYDISAWSDNDATAFVQTIMLQHRLKTDYIRSFVSCLPDVLKYLKGKDADLNHVKYIGDILFPGTNMSYANRKVTMPLFAALRDNLHYAELQLAKEVESD